VARLVAWYERLTVDSLNDIERLYRPDARFKDPFNDVAGTIAIRRVFEHMFATLQAPRFAVVDSVCDERACLLIWDFEFRRGGGAEELYEKLPVLGGLMRWLRRRLRAR
jgi:hypothetical protein